jgi:oxygen-independent coproporphyrinogen-3 oxidase
MAGIYFHIPFCKTRCIYCDFFSSIDKSEKKTYVEALCNELQERKNYLKGELVETIYFGGGTPSQLTAGDFEKIFASMQSVIDGLNGKFLKNMEITLEANPDDLDIPYLKSIEALPFNRISLGIQSFDNDELRFLNRRHNAESAIKAVELCRDFGFENISIDLMYGLPKQSLETWEKTLNQAIELNVPHISAYHLIYEKDTRLSRLLEEGRIDPVDEETSVRMFEYLIDTLTNADFEHYEISNFAQPGFRSKHNSSYWNGSHYLGIGASAHSYNGCSRQWNFPVKGADYRKQGFGEEIIDEKTAYNDFIITRLRTMEGIDLQDLISLFGETKQGYCLKQAQKYIANQLLEIKDRRLKLTRKGLFVSDGIMSALMD